MKIAQIITRSDTLGGASAHVRDLSIELIRLGHSVHVFVGGNGPIIDIMQEAKIPVSSIKNLVRQISPVKDYQAFCEIKQQIKDYQPDLVACHSAKAGMLGRLVAKNLHIPCIYTAHGWPFTEGVPWLASHVYRYIETLMARYTNKIITVSEYDKQLATSNKVAAMSKLELVWNGVADIPNLVASKSNLKNILPEAPLIVMVARFQKPKNFAALLRALALISDKPWQALLVGDGPDLKHTKALCEDLGLSSRVQFMGWCSDVSALLDSANIFALISDWEGLPLSILEAMRHSLPVIASNVGGVSEALIDGETGLLVKDNSPSEIATSLKQMLSEPALTLAMGQAGRARFEAHFTVGKMARQTLDVYQRALSNALPNTLSNERAH